MVAQTGRGAARRAPRPGSETVRIGAPYAVYATRAPWGVSSMVKPMPASPSRTASARAQSLALRASARAASSASTAARVLEPSYPAVAARAAHAQNAHQLDDGVARLGDRRDVRRGDGLVAQMRVERRHELADLASGLAGVEVVVHAGDELVAQREHARLKRLGVDRGRAVRRGGQQPVEVAHRVADAAQRRVGLLQALVGEVERAAVVGLQHEEAQHRGLGRLQHVAQQLEVAQRLAHLLGVDAQHARVHPVLGERAAACRLALGALVLVVREDQVPAAAVDVERQPQVLARHGGAFDMPAGAAHPPRRLPGGLAGFGRLPQREVERIALAVLEPLPVGAQLAVAALHLVDVAAGERAVTLV